MIVTAQKGVGLDYQAVGRDTKSLSKELFNWGQKEKDDVKDGEHDFVACPQRRV